MNSALAVKYLPLSLINNEGHDLLAMNLCSKYKKVPAVISRANSRCMAFVMAHVKMQKKILRLLFQN